MLPILLSAVLAYELAEFVDRFLATSAPATQFDIDDRWNEDRTHCSTTTE